MCNRRLPHQGQGAGQSIEDAEALGALFADAKSSQSVEDVNAVLEKVFKARIKRASLIQAYSRQQAMPAGKDDHLFLNAQQFSGYNWAYEGILAWIEKEASEEKKAI
jgi:salicylate hydroxylase